MRTVLLLLFTCVLAMGLTACGQRVQPKAPDGKIRPSDAY